MPPAAKTTSLADNHFQDPAQPLRINPYFHAHRFTISSSAF